MPLQLLPEGTRQITSFLMPGDTCDLHANVSDFMEHSIATLTAARIALVVCVKFCKSVMADGFGRGRRGAIHIAQASAPPTAVRRPRL